MTAPRERRPWAAHEDDLLRMAAAEEDPESDPPTKWNAIAQHIPDRSNKDCRKRWFAKMVCDVTKGGWFAGEDERLMYGIEQYGAVWSLVSSVVQTRNADQCAKRWTETLDPAIDRTSWTKEADEQLVEAIEKHGKVWSQIVKAYFPGRTGLAAKNRYSSILRARSAAYRASTDPSRSRKRKKKAIQSRNALHAIEVSYCNWDQFPPLLPPQVPTTSSRTEVLVLHRPELFHAFQHEDSDSSPSSAGVSSECPSPQRSETRGGTYVPSHVVDELTGHVPYISGKQDRIPHTKEGGGRDDYYLQSTWNPWYAASNVDSFINMPLVSNIQGY